MKQFFKYYLPYASISAVVIVLLLILGVPILRTIINAIVEEQLGKIISGYAMGLILPATLFAAFHVWRARNPKLRRDYLNRVRNRTYEPKEDIRAIIKSKEFCMELVGMAIITLLLTIFYLPLYIIMFPLFIPFDLWSWGYLHKSWRKDKFHCE